MDTWYLVRNIVLVLYLVSTDLLASVYLFVVLSISLPIYRNGVGKVLLIVSFSNDNSDTFGSISIPPTILLYSFCSYYTIHIQTGVNSPMPSGVGNDAH